MLDILTPIEEDIAFKLENSPKHVFGKNIDIHRNNHFPDLEGLDIAILGVEENRSIDDHIPTSDFGGIRESLYSLFFGNWNSKVADLGNIPKGNSLEDSIIAVKSVLNQLIQHDITCVLIGGSQDITYGAYRAFEGIKTDINLVSVDSRFDFSTSRKVISNDTYMGKIIGNPPLNLGSYSNLGYQMYYNAQEELDLTENLSFDTMRLGKINSDITLAEPVLRNADMVSLDLLGSMKSTDLGCFDIGLPNGFIGKEICTLSRYAGISDSIEVFGLYKCPDKQLSNKLCAQIIWYFIEGYNFREREAPFESDVFEKHTIATTDGNIVFFKSKKTQRWWIQLIVENPKKELFLPCSFRSYREALRDVLPPIWLKHKFKIS